MHRLIVAALLTKLSDLFFDQYASLCSCLELYGISPDLLGTVKKNKNDDDDNLLGAYTSTEHSVLESRFCGISRLQCEISPPYLLKSDPQ